MTNPTPSLRGAVDLGALGARSAPAAVPGAAGAPDGASAVLVEASDETFNQLVARTATVPAVGVVWSSQTPQSRQLLDTVVSVAEGLQGRLQVIGIDIATNPGMQQAFQAPEVPLALGLVQGQPVPLFTGVVSAQEVAQVLDQLLALAVQHGVTGRIEVDASAAPGEAEAEPELPPLHQEAFDAIERDDLDAATSAYERALAQDPKDADAALGLAQVALMRRTRDVDLGAARAAAAADPSDVDAAMVVADLDVLGGHVEDAFVRLVDLVRVSGGDDRDRLRAHLLELFAVVGASDERVRKARSALMSALF